MDLDTLLRSVVSKGASDLHLKVGAFPHMRVSGELIPLGEFGKVTKEDALLMAFSIMTNKQKQRFREAAEVDLGYGLKGLGRFRVNVFQQRGAVSIAIRAIPVSILGFEDLFLPKVLQKIAMEPRGLVLVTGTTGSGKSTSIAAMLNFVNEHLTRHIITIEDPIEFLHNDRLSIFSQREISVDASSFSEALRSALRQDPDVILVGEIRDVETAAIAIQAALTGHLVLSTLHTNDAPTAIMRMLDLGVPHFLLQATLVGILSQRLVRKVCNYCKEITDVDTDQLRNLGLDVGRRGMVPLAHGKGCEKCRGTGYMGRTCIVELIPFTEAIRRLTQASADVDAIRAKAREEGMRTLRESAIDKLLKGLTTYEEVLRVTWEQF